MTPVLTAPLGTTSIVYEGREYKVTRLPSSRDIQQSLEVKKEKDKKLTPLQRKARKLTTTMPKEKALKIIAKDLEQVKNRVFRDKHKIRKLDRETREKYASELLVTDAEVEEKYSYYETIVRFLPQ
jgi:Na+/phosphate symporter